MNESFKKLIKSDRMLLIDFHAEWCGPCKVMKPVLESFSKKNGDNVRVIKIDVDRNPEIARELQIQGVPTLMLFHNGKMLWRQSGVIQEQALQQLLDQYSGSA